MAIYVGNLSYSATADDITTLFTEYGTVESVQLPVDRETGRVRGFGFVNLSSDSEEESAIQALDGSEWMGRTLKVNKARPRENKQRSFEGRDRNSGWNGSSRNDSFSKSYWS